MMKANELRIGNLIQHNGRSFAVDTIDSSVLNGVEPIPLTRESLLKFSGWTEYTDNEDVMNLGWANGNMFIDHNFQFDFSTGLIKIEFVHKLQNLYFALTGEELRVKTKD